MANSEYNLTVVDGTALTISLSGPTGPAGAAGTGGGSGTVDTTIIDGSTNAVSSNAVFDALALKAPKASPSFTGAVSCTGPLSATVTGSTDAISGYSESAYGVNGSSGTSTAVFADTDSGTAIEASTNTGTYHATFGNTGLDQSFVARESGAFGWIRDSFTARINPVNTLTADRTYTLPNATGKVPVYTNIPTEGQVLTATDASGAATWVTAASATSENTANTLVLRNATGGTSFFGDVTVNGSDLSDNPPRLILGNVQNGDSGLETNGRIVFKGNTLGSTDTLVQGNDGSMFVSSPINGATYIDSCPISTSAALQFSTLTDDRSYNFPNASGTVALTNVGQTFSGEQIFSSTTRPTSSGTGTPAATSLITLQDNDNRDWIYSPNQQRIKTLNLATMVSTTAGTGSTIGHTAGATRLVVGTSVAPALALAGIYQTGNNNQAMMLALPNQTITSPSTFALTDFSRSVLLSFYGAFRASATGVNIQIGLGTSSQNGGVQMIDNGMAADLIWNGTNCDVALSVGKLVSGNHSISGATNATPIVITDTTHGYANGDLIRVFGVLGNTAANGYFTIANVATNTFELVGSVGNGAYTSGGTSNKSTALLGTVNDNTVFAIDVVATAGTASLYLNGEFAGSLAGAPLIKGASYANVVAYQVGNTASSQVSIDSLRVGVR